MHRVNSVTLFLALLIAATAAAGQSRVSDARPGNAAVAAPDISAIVDRLEEAQARNREHYRAYIMTRDYRLYGRDQQHPTSEVVAQVSFVPPDNKSFAIQQASGNSRGEKIVKNILEGETQRSGKKEQNFLTRDNYDFAYLGADTLDGHRCFLVQLIPKRKQTDLVKGRAWVDAGSYLVRRIEGELGKSPSWWLKSVKVTLTFGEAGGMWLQTNTRAVADVRWFGNHVLESQTLNLRTAESVARQAPVRKAPARPTRPAMAGEVMFVHP